MNIELWKELDGLVRANRITDSIAYLEKGLSNCNGLRFKALIGADFVNEPSDVAMEIDRFIHEREKTFPVSAVYLEMNGFSINPDRWYFDFFGYRHDAEESGDLDWLSEWDSGHWPETTLVGLEKVQRDFEWYSYRKGYDDADARVVVEFADLLVMCKFVRLIDKAVKTGLIEKRVPILATAHDFDIVPRFAA